MSHPLEAAISQIWRAVAPTVRIGRADAGPRRARCRCADLGVVVGRLLAGDAGAAVLDADVLLDAAHARAEVALLERGHLEVRLDAALDDVDGGVAHAAHSLGGDLAAAAAVLAGDDDAGQLVLELLVCGGWGGQARGASGPTGRGLSSKREPESGNRRALEVSPKSGLKLGFITGLPESSTSARGSQILQREWAAGL